MTVKQARGFFILMLIVLVILGIYQCFTMAHAFNLSPFTYQIRERGVSANYAYISGDTLYMNNMAVSVAAVLKAVALQADTLRGSSNIVGILDSALRIDPDSSSAVNVITFGGYGGGLRWNRATDKVQFTNDFSTWTDIGSGGSGSAGAEIHDSLDANWATFTAGGGTDEDSTFEEYFSQRWNPHPNLTGQYIGASTDSGFAEHVDSTSGNAYTRYWTPIWYWEIVPDSALPTWGRVEAAIAANGGGDITGVIANDWLTGSASSGDVSLGIDPNLLAAIYLEADTTVIEGTAVKIRNNDGVTEIKLDNDTVLVQNLNSGSLIFNVFGSPTDHNELTIKENQVIIGSGVTLSGYTETGDISNVGVTAPITGGGSSGSVTVGFDWTWLYGFVDTTTASIPVATLSNSVLYSWLYTTIDTSSATVLSVAMGNGGTGGGSNGALTLNVVGSDEIAVTADSIYVADSKIKSVHLEDGTVSLADHAANSVDSTKIVNSSVGNEDLQTGSVNSAKILDASVALGDMASNSVDSTKIVDASIGSGDIGTGRITTTHILDGTVALADHASNSVDSTKIVDASIGSGDIGTGRITTTHILDGTIVTGDIATGGVATADILDLTVAPADVDSTGSFIVANLRTRAANQGLIQSNNFKATDSDSTLKIGGGGGIAIGSNITLGTDITDDTAIVTLASEWAGMVLARGYRDDSTKYWDSVTIRGGSDSYGNYIEFGKLGSDTTGTTPRRRHLQVAIPVPMDADTVYDVALSYRVFDGAGGESTYVRLKWSTTPFDSTNIFKTAYTELDSTNGTTFDTLSAAYARTSVSRGSKIYALVTGLLYDKHVTWIRCYDLIMTYHRRYL